MTAKNDDTTRHIGETLDAVGLIGGGLSKSLSLGFDRKTEISIDDGYRLFLHEGENLVVHLSEELSGEYQVSLVPRRQLIRWLNDRRSMTIVPPIVNPNESKYSIIVRSVCDAGSPARAYALQSGVFYVFVYKEEHSMLQVITVCTKKFKCTVLPGVRYKLARKRMWEKIKEIAPVVAAVAASWCYSHRRIRSQQRRMTNVH